MKRSKSIVGIAVGISSIVLIVAGVIAHRSAQLLADTSDEMLRSKELELSLERLLSSMRDAETGQRGYILTGSEAYLFPYNDGAARNRRPAAHAGGAHAGARRSMEELQALSGLVTDEARRARAYDRLFRSGQRDEALALVRPGKVRDGCDPRDGGRARARRAAQCRAPHGTGARRPAGDPALEFVGQRTRDLPHGVAGLRGTARFRAPASQRGAARDYAAQHRRRGDRDRRAGDGHHGQSGRRTAHRLASGASQGQTARRNIPHHQRADARDGGEPGGKGAAPGWHRRPRESHGAHSQGGSRNRDRGQRRADLRPFRCRVRV